MTFAEHRNEMRWTERPDLMDWLGSARLNLLRGMFAPMLERPRTRERLLGMVRSGLHRANAKLDELGSASTTADGASVSC